MIFFLKEFPIFSTLIVRDFLDVEDWKEYFSFCWIPWPVIGRDKEHPSRKSLKSTSTISCKCSSTMNFTHCEKPHTGALEALFCLFLFWVVVLLPHFQISLSYMPWRLGKSLLWRLPDIKSPKMKISSEVGVFLCNEIESKILNLKIDHS